MYKLIFLTGLLVFLPCANSYAYIGPGLGAGGIAVVLGILSSIFFAIVGLIWYPLKKIFMKLRKGARQTTQRHNNNTASPGDE